MRSLALCAIFIWSSLFALSNCGPIHVAVLNSSYQPWMEVLRRHGTVNGTSQIETSTINETEWFTKYDLETVHEKFNDIAAVVGEYNKVVSVVADVLRIPYFITSVLPMDEPVSPHHIRMIPDIDVYTLAIQDLFQYYNWKETGVIYDSEGASKVTALLMEHIQGRQDLYDLRAYDVKHNSSAEVVRWALKDLRRKLITNFLIICSPSVLDTILTQALYLSLLSRPHSWLVVNMGSGYTDLEKYIDSRANMTLIRLMVDPIAKDCALNENEISLTDAVYYDIFRMISKSIPQDTPSNSTDMTSSSKLRVSRADVRNHVKLIDSSGCTGNLKFSKKDGRRNETFLQMLALEGLVNGARKLVVHSGTWRSNKEDYTKRVRPSATYSSILIENDEIFSDRVLRVTTKIEPPFVQWRNKTPEEIFYGNEQFEGFCIDILEEIANLLNFKFNITLVPDNKFGSLKSYGWTGMIKELIHDKADIALAPFSITPNRSQVVDFTKPFMTKGTSVVVRKPERSVWPFQFLSPLSKVVWIAIFLSFICVGLLLFGVTRVNCGAKTNLRDDLRDSLWYVWGTLLRAGLTGSPIATSGRIISATWWFFSLIIISIYTANLAAFLTISNAHIPISSAADLAGQDEYDYGTVRGQQIESFFEHTNIAAYQQMNAYMTMYKPDSSVDRVEQGFARVLKGKYAFIWDSPTVRHETANNCDLMEIGNPFDLKGYGIASQKHSRYSEPLSTAVLNLNDNGVLYRLEGKWWRRPNCPDPRSNAKSKEIEIDVASGMFIVLLSGCTVSIIVCILQYIIRKNCRRYRDYFEPKESDAQPNHNHVAASPLEDPVDETRVVLSRTLSIGENCVNSNRWEQNNACNTPSKS